MKRLMNYLRGMVTLTATGPFPERLLNLCAQEGVDFWALSWTDERTIHFTTRRRTMGLLRALAERVDCEISVEGSRGLPDFLLRFRTRYAFLAGMVLSLCAAAVLSQFVLTVQVTGNEKVPTAVILSELRRLGVRPGAFGPGLDRRQLAQEALSRLDGLSFLAINRYGTRLEVIVREEVPSPARIDEKGYFDIVAEADGLVTHLEAELGDAAVAEGDTVLAGDVLISGTVTLEPPKYSDLPARYYQVHARGRVWARTWRTLEAAIPAAAQVKEYTGAERSVWTLEALGRRFTLWDRGGAEGLWDSREEVWQARLPGGAVLPLTLRRETLREYETRETELDLTAAQALLEGRLLERLDALIGEDGTVESTRFTAKMEDGVLRVALTAECTEEIGKEVPGRGVFPEAG